MSSAICWSGTWTTNGTSVASRRVILPPSKPANESVWIPRSRQKAAACRRLSESPLPLMKITRSSGPACSERRTASKIESYPSAAAHAWALW